MSDLVTMAENKLDTLLAADDGNTPPAGDDTPPANDDQQPPAGGDNNQPPAGDDPNKNNEGDDPDDGQDDPGSEENQPPQGDEEEPDPNKKPEDDAGKPKGDEAPKELSDDELMAELERRGLKVAKKDEDEPDPKKQQEPPKFERPEELPEAVWSGMKPVQQYIYRELPYVTLEGKDGNVIRVKTPEQIPDDFEFASKRAEKIADDAFIEQNRKADTMYKQIQQTSAQQQEQTQRQQETDMIIKGVEQLQTDGIVPKITAEPGTPEFDKDPGVIRANEILAYRAKLIAAGEQVSVVSAGKMFKADHPELYVTKPTVSPADAERKAKSKNIAGGGRGTQQQAKQEQSKQDRSKYPVGMSITDIADIAGRDLE